MTTVMAFRMTTGMAFRMITGIQPARGWEQGTSRRSACKRTEGSLQVADGMNKRRNVCRVDCGA
jgi:hypothetical protein